MKIVVVGGTGLIGSKLVNKLRERGHEAVAAAPNTGVNSITGDGSPQDLPRDGRRRSWARRRSARTCCPKRVTCD
jgi:nucleoside-diphosphate-sugar epimerase